MGDTTVSTDSVSYTEDNNSVDLERDGQTSASEKKAQDEFAKSLGLKPGDERLVKFLATYKGDALQWMNSTRAALDADPLLAEFVQQNLDAFLGEWAGSVEVAVKEFGRQHMSTYDLGDTFDESTVTLLVSLGVNSDVARKSIFDMTPDEFTDIFDRIFALLRERGEVENQIGAELRTFQLDYIQSSFEDAMKAAQETRSGAIANLVISVVAASISLGVGVVGLRSLGKDSAFAQVVAQAFGPLGGTLGQLGPAVQQLFSANSQEAQASADRLKQLADLLAQLASAFGELRSGTMSDLSKLVEQLTQAYLSIIRVR
jgi:hypothetical protein